ncbi:ABC transporter substrate-binding protein [Cereibacter sp. SYSU M97828]|nr:ABC transporter substrate-binding protein [Cereibacter flavus]
MYSNMSAKSWVGIQERFSELYPWIEVEILELDSSELLERYLAEEGTGAPTCDFLTSGALERWHTLMAQDEVLHYASPEEGNFPEWSRPQPGIYTIAVDPLVTAFNKLILPEEMRPKSLTHMAELATAHPDVFDGKIAVFGADVSTAGFLAHKAYTDKYGDAAWETLRAFGPMTKSETSAGVVVEKILTGEYVAGYFLPSGIPWQSSKDPSREAVIGWDFCHDGQGMAIRTSAIPKAAKNVNCAKLWLDVTLSFEGQKGLVKGARTPLRADVTQADTGGEWTLESVTEAVGAENIMTPTYDPKLFADKDAYIARWKEAFGRPA